MSRTQTVTRNGVSAGVHGAPGAPGAPGVPDGAPAAPAQPDPKNEKDYSKRPNAPPNIEEAVPSAQWARWRLYKQRPDIQDNFPEYFPDVRRQLHDRLTRQIQAATKQTPDPPEFTKRSMAELTGPSENPYKPTQLGFAPLTDFYDEADHQNSRLSRRQRLDSDEEGDRIPSLWFERMSQDLFARVWEFCSETFGVEEIDEKKLIEAHDDWDWTLRWLDKLPHEFVVLASQVARGDKTVVKEPKKSDPNNWEFLFLDKMSRVKLLVGVMAKLLEKNVFNSLLFGANDVEKTALMADDQARAFLDNSYQRNRTRSETVRNYIQSNRPPLAIGLTDLFTDNFWDEVESVTMGILDLLLPFINLLGKEMPNSAWPPLTEVHQRLHDIVAEAAWFTNGMRATRSVFWIQFPLPGELNDISHEHAIDDIWNRSKRRALDYDQRKSEEWENKMMQEIAQDHPGEAITQAHRAEYQARNPPPFIRRTAKVQIAMWPFIKRYTTVGERDAGDGAYNAGETITQIMKAQTVYYYGDDSDEADMSERLTLSEQIKSRRWAKWFTTKVVLLFVFLLILLLVLRNPPPHDFEKDLRHQLWEIKSSSHEHRHVQGSKTTTVVTVPVGAETVRETVVVKVLDGEDKPSKSRHRSKPPSVSRATETITETITRKLGRGKGDYSDDDDDDDENEDEGDDYESDNYSESSESDIYSESSDSDSGDDEDSFTSTIEDIAADVASGADRVTTKTTSERDDFAETIVSGADRVATKIASEEDGFTEKIASGADQVAASFASGADRAGASMAAAENEAAASIASGADRVAASFTSAADRAGASIAPEEDEPTTSTASEGDIIAAEDNRKNSESRADWSSSSESEPSSKRPARESEASELRTSGETRGEKQGSKSSKSSEGSKSKKGKKGSESSESSKSVESVEITENTNGRSASKRRAAVQSSTSRGSETGARTAARPASEDIDIEKTTVYKDEDGTIGVMGVTSSKVAAPPKREMETTTITVPADKVVVTVTGPPTPAETKGTLKEIYHRSTRPLSS